MPEYIVGTNPKTGQPILKADAGKVAYSIRGMRVRPAKVAGNEYRVIGYAGQKVKGQKAAPTFFDAAGEPLTTPFREMSHADWLGSGVIDLVNGVLILSTSGRGAPLQEGISADALEQARIAARAAALTASEDGSSQPQTVADAPATEQVS
jgi:hypothetical protein